MNQPNSHTPRKATTDLSLSRDVRAHYRRPLSRAFSVTTLGLLLGACTVSADPAEEPAEPVVQQGLSCGSSELFARSHAECDSMDAVAMPGEFGPCDCSLGVAWNGNECVALGDCQCVGEDCDKLSQTVEECQAAHAQCNAPSGLTISCGAEGLHVTEHDQCGAMDAVAIPDVNGSCDCELGVVWDGSDCVPLNDCQCLGSDCDKLAATHEECMVAHAECLASSGLTISCGAEGLHVVQHDQCQAMDAAAIPNENGSCDCGLGVAWNGSECVALNDCQCLGSDCDKLAATHEECVAAHGMCQ